jgi:hypothetical protein
VAAPRASTEFAGAAGYWIEAADGGVYQFGTANFGSLRGTSLSRPVVGGSATNDGLGYWMVASDGGVFTFGDAGFYGSTGNVHLNKPIVGMAADPSSHGYWMVASDGGVFTFGGARFFGSTGNVHLVKPIVGMAATPGGGGYWLVASDGGVFSFGDAGFFGSTGNVHLVKPIVGMAAAPSGRGYWLVASDGGLFTFGDAPFIGSATGGPAPVVGIMATARGYPFLPGGTGYDISLFQCQNIPGDQPAVRVVQVSGGSIDSSANPCYRAEAEWAGVDMSAYIFMDGLPSPAPTESLTGPAGTCDGNTTCQAYNFGWAWARHWVDYSRAAGFNPDLWWLDVETDGLWNLSPAAQAANGRVIAGAVAGLRSMGVLPGIYATAYQWGKITGDSVNFPGIPLWVPGAGNISGGTYSAAAICAGGPANYAPFADGSIVLIQYGYSGSGYTGPAHSYDLDYACR